MPRHSRIPTLYNEVSQLSITKLKEWGYLDPGQIRSGTLNWSRNGRQTNSVSIYVNTFWNQPHIELDYTYGDESRNYRIELVSQPSNLGKGEFWYFKCPQTDLHCRILYLVDGYFFHRKAFSGVLYESQTQSKIYRALNKTLGAYFRAEQNYDLLYAKHFKRTYAGKPTKKYSRIAEQIHLAESIPYSEIERLMVFGV